MTENTGVFSFSSVNFCQTGIVAMTYLQMVSLSWNVYDVMISPIWQITNLDKAEK